MWIIPAIDLLAGQCVRLYRGDYRSARVYSRDPAEVARSFAGAGAVRLHVVDLDAARGGEGPAGGPGSSGAGADRRTNRPLLARIRRAFPHPIQVGGGIRSEEDIRELLDMGMDRLVLGTVLVRDPQAVASWCARYRPALWGGIDALDGQVKVAGWCSDAGLEDIRLAREAQALGIGGLVYTSIARDGTLEGPDIERTNRVADAVELPVILSGGIGGPQDVETVFHRRHPGLRGLILGKALYESRVDLAAMIRSYPQAEEPGDS
jgi:phosphoribosylformimino-5-aminoimidazole carboxamide ribotide isomerase